MGKERALQAQGSPAPEDYMEMEERVVDIYRSAKVMKGGRVFRFGAVVVVGDGAGKVGFGYGKAREVPQAIEKALKAAKKSLERFPLVNNTLPHRTRGCFGGSDVLLLPAGPGTGVIAGSAVKAVAECLGVHNLLSKSYGSNNSKNVVKATLEALRSMRTREHVAKLRGVSLA
jgi:small subunit ribosomal protein S5